MTSFATRRQIMVDTQIRPADVTKYPVIEAFLAVPREDHLPNARREAAYIDADIDLGEGRTLLAPRTIAKMLDVLDLSADKLVLNVASGYGYTAMLLARMAQAVIALEDDEERARDLQELLEKAGADNVILQAGPLAQGVPDHAPYDIIFIEGGVGELPIAIADQLAEGGQIAALFVDGPMGEIRHGIKTGGGVSWRPIAHASAPAPLSGYQPAHEFHL